MPWGKKKSYQLVQNKKQQDFNVEWHIGLKNNVSPSSSFSSTSLSKGLLRKNDIPKQVNNSKKLKKIL